MGDHYDFDGIKGLTLEQFKAMDIDIVIASVPDHLPVYTKLIKDFKPKAKLIFQMGNEFPVDFSLAKNILSSTAKFRVPSGTNACFYHQEFDLEEFSYIPPTESNLVRSFVHCLGQEKTHFEQDWKDFLTLEKTLPELCFESYGSLCRNGTMGEGVAEAIQQCKFGVMFKDGGDGFGHVLWNFAFCGRPLIVKKSQYKGKLGECLMVDGKTCFDLEIRGFDGVAKSIRELTTEKHEKMCKDMYDLAKKNCNFNEEEKEIGKFLENLI